MSRSRKILIGVAVAAVLAVVIPSSLRRGSSRGIEVRLEPVTTRDLVATVTANGNVRATRSVDISSDVSGRVVELNVTEGQEVQSGEILMRIDPTQFEAAVARAEASLAQTQAQVTQQEASLRRTEREFQRIEGIWGSDSSLVSRQQLEDAESQLELARATLDAARQGRAQARATVEEARDRLSKTVFRAPIDGRVTRLNIELGETAVVGTMNNPGSLLLTISDLSSIEVVMRVDETDVPRIALGDSALIEIDAFPDRTFRGSVTEIGNSATQAPSQSVSGQAATVDFEVVIVLEEPEVELRPDLSATADIITDTRDGVVAIPIIALTVRDPEELEEGAEGRPAPAADTASTGRPRGPVSRAGAPRSIEGVFVARAGTVEFVPTRIGIAGQDYFEVLSGVEPGDTVVSGPYQRIRELRTGDAVRAIAGSAGAGPGGSE